MSAKEDFYDFVEGDDINSIVLDRNILPLRNFPLCRGEDICYLIQNIAGRQLAATGSYSHIADFIKFSNKPQIADNGKSGGFFSFNQISSLHTEFVFLITPVEHTFGFVKNECEVPNAQSLSSQVGIYNGTEAMAVLGLLESFDEEIEEFQKYATNNHFTFPREKYISYMMDVFWKKMMRPVVNGSHGGMYFLLDRNCVFDDVHVNGKTTIIRTGLPSTSFDIEHTKTIISVDKSKYGDSKSSTEFSAENFTYQRLTTLGHLVWSQNPFLFPVHLARFTDGSKNKQYLLFSVVFYREESGHERVSITQDAYVEIPRGDITTRELQDEILKFLHGIGVDTSDPEDGSFSLSVTMKDFFSILEFTEQMTIDTKKE